MMYTNMGHGSKIFDSWYTPQNLFFEKAVLWLGGRS